MLKIYTDGSCLGNPGKGGWGYAITFEGSILHEDSGRLPDTTNNVMELIAAIRALSWLDEHAIEKGLANRPIHIFTDSKYVMNGVQEWSKNWIKNGWKTAGGNSVKNKEVWQTLLSKTAIFNLEWHWVKGHSGDHMNEHVDQLARAAAESCP